MWNTLEKDPIFGRTTYTLPLEEQRKKVFLQVKQLIRYNFVSEKDAIDIMKLFAFQDCIAFYDYGLYGRYILSLVVGPAIFSMNEY